MTTDDSRGPRLPGAFPTTHWSVVINAGKGSEKDVRRALESLCGQYWYPLYKFIRRQGRTHHQAEDCTQAFLAKLLASEGVARARPERGRFRTFLLASLRNFMVNDWQRERAEKRGAGWPPSRWNSSKPGNASAASRRIPGSPPSRSSTAILRAT